MPAVYGYVYMRTSQNRAIAEDIVSEIFTKAVENFDQFDEKKGSFKSWIFQIARNYLIDHFRSKKNQKTESLEETTNYIKDPNDPQKDAKDSIEKELVKEVINTLPEDKKELIILRYFSGYSIAEIAEITDENPNNLRVKLHRIQQELKRKLVQLN
ncbi:hypothetical protein A3I58_01075 [Candidatus Peregrinibacteria bacterium RIFCSPLOWO2_02_FULL_39_10]|nr:MAG: hypothetical protein A3I58_01075 [Candidatus Peregrinibacteria bacterium RIFCSPLOWO2_02_FULL_39_10]